MLLILPVAYGGYFLVRQIRSFLVDLPSLIERLRESLVTLNGSQFASRLGISALLDPEKLGARLEGEAGRGVGYLVSWLSALLGAGTQLLLIFLFTILMLASRVHLRRSSEAIIATHSTLAPGPLLDEISSLIERFLTMRGVIVVIIGAIDTAIIAGFGLPYAFLMGTWLGIMTLVPAVGFIVGVVPPMLLALGTQFSALQILALLSALLIMSAIEGNVLTPKLVGRRLNINTLSTFMGIFAGALIWGPWGMFLSIPVLGIARVCLSVSSRLAPWGELLAEKSDPAMLERLQRQRRHWTL